MKKSFALITRVLAAAMLWTSLLSAGFAPARPVHAEIASTNVFASSSVTASAYGYSSGQDAPSEAIDGNLKTGKWVYQGDANLPGPHNPYWLKIDVGTEATVQQFVLAHAGSAGEPDKYNTRNFTIEASQDDVTWTQAVAVTGNTYGLTTHNLSTPVTARYFKLNITHPGDPDASTGLYTARIYEFQAYGYAEPAKPQSSAAVAPLAANASLVNYAPMAIAMSFNGSPKTNRSFAWYTSYEQPENAPAGAADSIVEIVTADQEFNSTGVRRFVGKPEETKILNLKITGSTTGSFISHKVLADGLTPGTAYKYRVGSDGNWSSTGSFTTEAENENNYEFLYMTDSQGSNSQDYEVFANTLKQGLQHFPNSKFMVMTGDEVDAGSLESQWLDYFGKPQDMFLKLPIMAAVGNHEGPYNDNYYYHFNYPNDSIQNPLPPGSVYSYDYGDAHIMVLNTMDIGWDDRQKESFRQQVEWLKKEVAETDKKWKVVAFHKAIYSLGNHALDTDILDMRKMLYPIFDELGIDVVLQGHDHTFMRSYQMYDNKPVANVPKDENGNALNPDGTLYMINNSAGTKYYDLKNGVDRYYAAVFEQPKIPIYSGIRMTENSFTIDSYRSGQDKPFDTYTIVRNDNKPAPVDQLTGGKTGDGKAVISWNRPTNVNTEDEVRGYRIYEAHGKLGMNWSAYVPAVKDQDHYQYIAAESARGETYEFVVKAVDKRDNSIASTVSISGNAPAAPTAPAVDDGHNTFGWTNVPGYAALSDYEYSVDGGKQWLPVTANPQPVDDTDYAAGMVKVRIHANAASGMEAGLSLASNKPFTVNSIHDTYQITGEVKRGDQLQVNVTLEPMADYSAEAYTVFELLDGDQPILINAVPVKQDKLKLTQYFNVTGTNYKVKVFVIDRFNSDLTVPIQLARPILIP